jgi:hypothetical protein
MTEELDRAFDDRRARKERTLAEQATDTPEVIAHRQLAELHEKKAFAIEGASANGDPLTIAAVEGNVTVTSATGEVASLTPMAAMTTSDRLTARAREAERQTSLSKADSALTP